MNSTQAVLFLAFANDAKNPLAQLAEEESSIRDVLHDRTVKQQHFYLHRDSYADVSSIRQYLTEFRNQVWLFHYAGHAGSEELFLTSGTAQASGIAAMLAEQSSLKLVFLNGCSTQAQVQGVLELGIPAVIATRTAIEDKLAREFAWHFYDALKSDATIQQAFEAASNFAQAAGHQKPVVQETFMDDEEESETPKDDTWGLFYREDRTDVLTERLPSGSQSEIPKDFEPNQVLIDSIWNALEEEGIVSASRKKATKLSRKRMDILNNLPAPIAEHLRKLFVPMGDADEGYNKIGINRLRQLVRCYQILMELMTFTLLAQVWEQQLKATKKPDTPPLVLSPELQAAIRGFLEQSGAERELFAFIPFIRQIRTTLDHHQVAYFVEELSEMVELVATDSDFRAACSHFDFLRKRLAEENDTSLQPMIGRLCLEAEEHLAAMFAELGYLAHYTLATVKQIMVRKFRHHDRARFEHVVVRLVDLLGGMDEEEETFSEFLDSQSVLLLKEEEENEQISFLNLSPFIIDKNAFVDNSDVSKIYFFHHFQSHPEAWAYRWVHKPNDPVLLVPGKEYEVVEEQMQAFIDNLQ